MLKRILPGLAIAMISGGAAVAGALEDGVTAYKTGDYQTALALWMPLAEDGDAVAQFNVGIVYDQARGVERNADEAIKWYLRAAKLGDVISQFKLGLTYAEGQGIQQDYDQAAKWYTLAAANNHVRAQYSLGTLYANGRGVPQSLSMATEWYERAENTSCTYGDTEAAMGPRLN